MSGLIQLNIDVIMKNILHHLIILITILILTNHYLLADNKNDSDQGKQELLITGAEADLGQGTILITGINFSLGSDFDGEVQLFFPPEDDEAILKYLNENNCHKVPSETVFYSILGDAIIRSFSY